MNEFNINVTNSFAEVEVVQVILVHGIGQGGPVKKGQTTSFKFQSEDFVKIKIHCGNHEITNKNYIKCKSDDEVEVYTRNTFWKLRIDQKQPGYPSTNVEVGTRDDDREEK
jgi:hypothetical protein